MDGMKRKVHSSSPPLAPTILDFGSTPPWSLPAILYEESAIRSTLATPEETVDPSVLQRPHSPDSIIPSRWEPLHRISALSSLPQRRTHKHKRSPGFGFPDAEDLTEDDEITVDTEHDNVYLINSGENTWTGTLPSEDDPREQQKLPFQAELALKQLKRNQALAQQGMRLRAANLAIESLLKEKEAAGMTPEDKAKWNLDLLLRNMLRQVKKKLEGGATLDLQRSGSVNATITCAHPLCSAANNIIAAGSYYVIVNTRCRTENDFHFCLSCIEGLWNGQYMRGLLPDPQIYLDAVDVQERVPSFALDGAMDEVRLRTAGLPPVGSILTPSPRRSPSKTTFTPVDAGPFLTPPPTRHNAATQEAAWSGSSEEAATNAPSDSPLLRKSQLLRSGTLSTDGLSFQNPKVSVAKNVKNVSKKPNLTISTEPSKLLRRSSRIESLSSSNLSSVSTASSIQQLTSPEESTSCKPRSKTADAIANEVERADRRLNTMYQNREKALRELLPGEWRVIENPKHSNSKNKFTISMDCFGVVYTDLLANHVSYWTKQTAIESFERRKTTSSGAVALSMKKASNLRMLPTARAADRWCICHGVEYGEMIQCGNEKCLVGWYHVDCIKDNIDEKEEWSCALCSSLESRHYMPSLSSADSEIIRGVSAPVFAAQAIYDVEPLDLSEDRSVSYDTDYSLSLSQVDGPTDAPTLQIQHLKMDPLKSTSDQIPASLLSSKHAPPPDELPRYLDNPTRTRSPTPPLISPCQTPGSPQSLPGSVNSSGEWENPPTRFQYLAQFFTPGDTLNSRELAALDLWKQATEEQLYWNEHRERYKKTIQELRERADKEECYASEEEDSEVQNTRQKSSGSDNLKQGMHFNSDASGTRSGSMQRRDDDEESSDRDEDFKKVKAICRKMYYGKDLTAVLAEMHSCEGTRNE